MSDDAEPRAKTQRFAEYVSRAALEAGYDIHSPRGGGKKALAEAAGMSPSSVGRMLNGQTMPDAAQLAPLAAALRVPLSELLVRSGIVPRELLPNSLSTSTAPARPTTPAAAAQTWGIHSPARIAMLEALVRHLAEEEAADEQRKAS